MYKEKVTYWGGLENTDFFIRTGTWLLTYNPETHELVEKKEAKIKRLTQEIQDAKELLEAKSKFFDDEILKMKQLSAEIEELEKELKEAEK